MEQEEERHAVAAEPEEEDGLETSAGACDEGRGDDDDEDGHDLRRGVPEPHRLGPGRLREEHAARTDDEDDEDDAEIERQGTTLGERGDVRREVVEQAHETAVDAVGLDDVREGGLEPLDRLASDEEQRADAEDRHGEEERRSEPGPERQVAGLPCGVGVGVRLEERLAGHGYDPRGQPEDREDQCRADEEERLPLDRRRVDHRRLGGSPVRREAADGDGGRRALRREGPPEEPQPVGDGEHRAQDDRPDDDRADPRGSGGDAVVHQGLESRLLRYIAGEGRQTDH